MLGDPTSEGTAGRCRDCGAERTFTGGMAGHGYFRDYPDTDPRLHHASNAMHREEARKWLE